MYVPTASRAQQIERNVDPSARSDADSADEILRPWAVVAQLWEVQETHDDNRYSCELRRTQNQPVQKTKHALG